MEYKDLINLLVINNVDGENIINDNGITNICCETKKNPYEIFSTLLMLVSRDEEHMEELEMELKEEKAYTQSLEKLRQYEKDSLRVKNEQIKELQGKLKNYNRLVAELELLKTVKDDKYKLETENRQLRQKLKETEVELETVRKGVISAHFIHREKVKQGVKKIGYKEDVPVELVKKLHEEGLTYIEIGEKLGVSKSTVWRRLKEGK